MTRYSVQPRDRIFVKGFVWSFMDICIDFSLLQKI